ncbi:helix-turn-helix domain-containing protein [Flexistipes sp.]|uniref:helix-turn-helix domain-containing protein n=1 Tax=Flexistipes sp. TaxID=3088135 RepID=UPI002E1DB4DF|nr:helix-turn-helix domain-containing protein [Flexistipes sp.]
MKNSCKDSERSGNIKVTENVAQLFDNLIGRDEDELAAVSRIFLKSGDDNDFRLTDITDQYYNLVKELEELKEKLADDGNVLLTVSEVAELFRCHEQHIRNMKSKGKFRKGRHYINFGGKILFKRETLLQDFGLWANKARRC